MSMKSMLNTKVKLLKANGEIYDDIDAHVGSNSILIMDSKLPIEEGDSILHDLPSGLVDSFLVIDRGFKSSIGNFPDHYKVKFKKQKGQELEKARNQYNFYMSGNSRVNSNSIDNSNNEINSYNNPDFSDIREAISKIESESDKEKLDESLTGFEDSIKNNKSDINERYKNFMSLAADHMAVISPFIPMLLEYIV